MKILLYEWCCSGGLATLPPGDGLGSLACEGRMMLEALAADAARDPALDVAVLIDEALPIDLPQGIRPLAVRPGEEVAALVAAATDADWTLIVAPETDGLLSARVAAVRAAGGRVLGPDTRFLEIASDKQATIDALAAAGVPVPAGRPLAANEPLPVGFHLPAVRKARAGAGGDGLQIIRSQASQAAAPIDQASRLEAFVPGMTVGVSCLCGDGSIDVLPPLQQFFTAGDEPRSLTSGPLDDVHAGVRAASLARRAVAAIERAVGRISARGWVGVDMVLGPGQDGRDDRVLEINPRVTTSFVMHARAGSISLVRSMLERACRARDAISCE
jgi:predicted ATP-grasp superfamily ATP-dependent carboligase